MNNKLTWMLLSFGIVGIVALFVIAVTIRQFFGRSPNMDTTDDSPDEVAGGFRQWVKDPEYKRSVAQKRASSEQARDSISVPDDISDSDIHDIVERLFVQEDKDGLNYQRLKLIGKKAESHLLRALSDSRVATRFDPGGYPSGPNYPLQRICGLLEEFDKSIVVQTLAKYAEHKDDHIRQYVGDSLSRIGTVESIGPVLQTLSDDDDYVRSHTMIGISFGIKDQTASKEFLIGIFPGLVKLLNRSDSSVGGEAPQLMLRIDTHKALPILLSAEYLTVENTEVHYIIRALNNAGHKIPQGQLLPLLKQLKPMVSKYPHSYQFAEVLKAYARNPDHDAEQVIRAELKSAEEMVQEAAAESLGILMGIENPTDVVFAAHDENGFEGLTKPQQTYFAVFLYDAEVRNGGHAQYYVNSTGDNWQAALAGLKLIGANQRAAILQAATDLFGSNGPSIDNEKRHRQIAKFSDDKDKQLNELDDKYYKCKESVETLLFLHVLKNKADFVEANVEK